MAQTIDNKNIVGDSYTSLFRANQQLLERGSSPLFNQMREAAIKRFNEKGIPGLKDEDYKYTHLQEAFERDYTTLFHPEGELSAEDLFRCNVPALDTHPILICNGWYAPRLQAGTDLPDGIVAGSIRRIANERPELVKNYLNRQAGLSEDPFVALNTAFVQDGFFLYIPDHVVLEKPLQVINILRSEGALFSSQRNLIVVGKNSHAKVVFCDHTLGESRFLSNVVTEVYLEQDSDLEFYAIQSQNNQTTTINSVFFNQNTNSHLLSNVSTLHGGVIRNNLKVSLSGEHAESNIFGMSFTDKKQHVDNFTNIDHKVANCVSNQLYKNVLDEQSVGVFAGRIHVVCDAQKTNAFQRNNNILLTDQAKINTKPQLIIDADDVKCSHGATIGQLDEEALFYMEARGINKEKARLMLMNAFAHEVIREIRIEPLRQRIDELVERRLNGDYARCFECGH